MLFACLNTSLKVDWTKYIGLKLSIHLLLNYFTSLLLNDTGGHHDYLVRLLVQLVFLIPLTELRVIIFFIITHHMLDKFVDEKS